MICNTVLVPERLWMHKCFLDNGHFDALLVAEDNTMLATSDKRSAFFWDLISIVAEPELTDSTPLRGGCFLSCPEIWKTLQIPSASQQKTEITDTSDKVYKSSSRQQHCLVPILFCKF
jgi:hypothetical protein